MFYYTGIGHIWNRSAVTTNEQEAESIMQYEFKRDYDDHDNVPHISCQEFQIFLQNLYRVHSQG